MLIKKRARFSAICLLLLLTAISAGAQNSFTKVDDWLTNHTTEMGGRSILMIYKDGKIIHTYAVNDMTRRQKAVGKFIARRQGKEADNEPYTPSTKQAVASCSKWFSAALIMTFVDEGKLMLNDTVGKWLPVLSQHGKGNITIGQCLSHLTGIKAPPLKESLSEMKKMNNMEEAIAAIADLPMEGEPGKTFHYSSVGLQIAGALVEKISGQNFEELFSERIAKPLGLKNTDFGQGKVAHPAGGANSTPEDYLDFLVMILNGGVFNGKRILSEHSIAAMQVDRVADDVKVAYAPAEAGDFGYGYGEWVMEKLPGSDSSRTLTSPGLFGSFPWIDLEKKYAGFLFTFYLQSEGRNERYKTLKKLVDEAIR